MKPSVSVIVETSTWHEGGRIDLAEALEALRRQRYAADRIEIVVVVTPANRQRWAALAPRFPGAIAVEAAPGLSFYQLKGVGLRHARGDIVTFVDADNCVPGPAHPAVLGQAQHAEPRVAHLAQDRLGPVGGAVVHDDELEVRDGLGEHAPDRPADQRRAIVGGQDDADARHHCPLAPLDRGRAGGHQASPPMAAGASIAGSEFGASRPVRADVAVTGAPARRERFPERNAAWPDAAAPWARGRRWTPRGRRAAIGARAAAGRRAGSA